MSVQESVRFKNESLRHRCVETSLSILSVAYFVHKSHVNCEISNLTRKQSSILSKNMFIDFLLEEVQDPLQYENPLSNLTCYFN